MLYANIIGKNIRVDNENLTLEGIVIDVDSDGCLIIDSSKGKIRLVCGDITFYDYYIYTTKKVKNI